MEVKIKNPFCGGVMFHNLPSSRLESIIKPDHPLREGVGLLFISNTEVSLPEHPPSKYSMEQGVGESNECANALRTDKSSCMASEHPNLYLEKGVEVSQNTRDGKKKRTKIFYEISFQNVISAFSVTSGKYKHSNTSKFCKYKIFYFCKKNAIFDEKNFSNFFVENTIN